MAVVVNHKIITREVSNRLALFVVCRNADVDEAGADMERKSGRGGRGGRNDRGLGEIRGRDNADLRSGGRGGWRCCGRRGGACGDGGGGCGRDCAFDCGDRLRIWICLGGRCSCGCGRGIVGGKHARFRLKEVILVEDNFVQQGLRD